MSKKHDSNEMIIVFNTCRSLVKTINDDIESQVVTELERQEEAGEEINEQMAKASATMDKDLLAQLSSNFERIMQYISVQLVTRSSQVLFGYLLAEIGELSIDYTINSFSSLDVGRNTIKLVLNPLYMEDRETGEVMQFTQMVTQVVSDLTKMMYDHPAEYAKAKTRKQDEFKHEDFIEASDITSTEVIRRDYIKGVSNNEAVSRVNIPNTMQTRTKAEVEYNASAAAEKDVNYYEKYIEKYKPKNQNDDNGQPQGSPSGGQGRQSNDWGSVQDAESYQAMVKQIVGDALDTVPASQRGLIPGQLMEHIEEYLKPPIIPWQELLRRYVGGYPSGYRKTSLRFDRRQPENPLLKGKLAKKLIKIIIAIDTSGSMDRQDIEYALSEIHEIIKAYPTLITIIECDAQIGKVYEVKKATDIQTEMTGRGGTYFSPVIEFINADRQYHGSLLIYFTDGGGERELTEVPRTRKNLWIMTRDRVEDLSLIEPYGEVKALADDPKYQRMKSGYNNW